MIQGDSSPLASDVTTTLKSCMPEIQLILDKGGTASTDFTLHDGGHAFRVAQRMCEIIPAEVLDQLSIYELAFLLLSAYLHDIGMTPELRKVTDHYNFLLTGEDQTLSQEEIHDFQKWLDDDGRRITPPLTKTTPTTKDLKTCQEVITYYARARHNEWGAEWINQHLGSCKLGQYTNWVDDIIKLCRSHHLGYSELKDLSFNPVVVSPGGIVVHLRYLACVLRIADILEFDPERTPSVIFRHRNVSPDSRIYWWRDHHVTLVQEGNNLKIHARPSDAPTEHAIRLMVDAIDLELQICRSLDEETHFKSCPLLDRELPHKWNLSTTVSTNIVPKDNAYEYINGSFRPDTEKLLQLLSGTALYGNPLIAVRELLQNAFDAVREKIAYIRLNQGCPSDPQLASKIGELHTVSLRLEKDSEGFWLHCTDNGVGMTRSIIENHLLVSGTTARHDVLELERKCIKEGFLLGRTGQFGIGVLSYFMIADRVIIDTKRSQEPRDADDPGWRFETAGVGSFGELRKQQNLSPGTLVRLHLREDVVGPQPGEWFKDLTDFLKKTLRHIPCKFELSTTLPGTPNLSFSPGWCSGQKDFAKKLLHEIRRVRHRHPNETPIELLSSTRRQEIEAEEKHIEIVRNEAAKCLRWKVCESEMPDGVGKVRIHVPYFDLQGKEALAFLRMTEQDHALIAQNIHNGYIFIPSGRVYQSWKGMAVESESIDHRDIADREFEHLEPGAFVEVDWFSAIAGSIAVNRTRFLLNTQSTEFRPWITEQCENIRSEIAKNSEQSVFGLLNRNLTNSGITIWKPLSWLALENADHGKGRKWMPLKFPLISRNTLFDEDLPTNITWKRSKVSTSGNIQGMHDNEVYEGLTWYSERTPPDKIMLMERAAFPKTNKRSRARPHLMHAPTLIPIWTTPPKLAPRSHAVGYISKFPRKWPTLCVAEFEFFIDEEPTHIWNSRHPILSLLSVEGLDWCAKTFAKPLDPLPLKNEILSTSGRASAWVMMCLRTEAQELWEGAKERDPSFLKNLWEIIFPDRKRTGSREQVICKWVEDDSRLLILSPSGWLDLGGYNQENRRIILKHVPDPGLEWKVIVNHPEKIKGRKTVV